MYTLRTQKPVSGFGCDVAKTIRVTFVFSYWEIDDEARNTMRPIDEIYVLASNVTP
jgi:hypothetical protein